jgi:hypothetical protein
MEAGGENHAQGLVYLFVEIWWQFIDGGFPVFIENRVQQVV